MTQNKLYVEIYMVFKELREKIVMNLVTEQDTLSEDDIEKLYQITEALDNLIHKIDRPK